MWNTYHLRSPPRLPGFVHKWLHFGTFWRCVRCLQVARVKWPRKPRFSVCLGDRDLPFEDIAALGHSCIALECSDEATLLICMHCKSYSSHCRFKGLKEDCPRKPTRFGKWVWSTVSRGLHPKRADLTVNCPLQHEDLRTHRPYRRSAGSYSDSEEEERRREQGSSLAETATLLSIRESLRAEQLPSS